MCKCANGKMCKCANDLVYNISIWTLQTKTTIHTFTHLHIHKAFAHSHICTFTHLHIHKAFAHLHICTFPPHDLRITTYRWQRPRRLNNN